MSALPCYYWFNAHRHCNAAPAVCQRMPAVSYPLQPPSYNRHLQLVIAHSGRKFGDLKSQEAANLLWALAKAEHPPPQDWLQAFVSGPLTQVHWCMQQTHACLGTLQSLQKPVQQWHVWLHPARSMPSITLMLLPAVPHVRACAATARNA